MFNALCYNRDVTRISAKKSEQLAMKLSPETYKTLADISEREDRPLGYVARELMIRGLAQYEIDGSLRDIAPKREQVVNKTATARRLAPVVAHISGAPDPKAEVRRMINQDEIKEIERRVKVPVLKQKAK